MNDDSMTIDRIQVEFSTNLESLIASLHTAESRIDAVNNSFARSETASESYAASMEQAGTAAAASSEGFAALATNIDSLSGSSAAGAEAAAAYANAMNNTQGAITTINYQMDLTVDRFNEVNTAATNTATAIGRVNNISNNAYTTFNRLSTNSTTAMKSIAKLASETRTLESAYATARTGTEAFSKSISQVGTAANTVTTQINEYSAAISTAGDESKSAADDMEQVTEKTGETEGAMSKLKDAAAKAFSGLTVGTLLDTLDTIIDRATKVSQTFQNLDSDILTSLGSIDGELSDELNTIVENLYGVVPAAQNTALAKGLASLYKYQPDLDTGTYEDLMTEYASYADLWNMNLGDLIGATQRLFTKYNITSADQMKEALGMINAVNNMAPDAAPSSVISILNNNRQAIGASSWSFEDALSRVVNAGNDRAMSKFQEYLNALQTVKATKGKMFDSDEAFAAWIQSVTEIVRNAGSETEAQNIIQTEFDIRGTSAMEIAKYLRLEDSDIDRTAEILAQLEKNGSGYAQYRRQETSDEAIARTGSVPVQADKTLGDGVLDIKERIAEQNAYEKKMYDVVSVRLGDLTTYIDKIPVVGEILSPLTGILKDYVPEINIKKGIEGSAEEFIDKYESRLENNEYTPFDENYYLAYRTLADQLQIDYSDLQFTGTDASSVREDFYAGLYTDLIQRVKSAQNGEEVMTLAERTAEVIAGAGITLNVDNFTGTLQLPDGTVLEGAEAAEYLTGTVQQEPAVEPVSVFDTIGSFFANLWPFGSADAAELMPETATVQGDFAAVAQGNADVSAAGDMMIAAEKATIVADLEPLADMIKPQITVEVTVPAESGTWAYQMPAVATPEMPAPVFALQASSDAESSQASVGFAAESMAEALAAIQQPVIQVPAIEQPETPSVSVDPQIAVTPAVSADAYLTVPEISVNPALSVLPQIALDPQVDLAPVITTTVPDIFVDAPTVPDIAVNPSLSVFPDVAVLPDILVKPQIAVQVPELSAEPASAPQVLTTFISPDPAPIVLPEIPVMQQVVQQTMQDTDYSNAFQYVCQSIDDLKNAVSLLYAYLTSSNRDCTIKAGDTAITQNFYAPTVDSYTVKNAASLAVSAAQAKACRM